MNFVLTQQIGRYPEGTSVSAYPLSNWPGNDVRTNAAPLGSAAATATMTGGTLTFTGLTNNAQYVAYAQVGGEHRYVSFRVGDNPPLSEQTADNVAITGGSITGITDLAVADGGTGSSTAAGARTNLGVDTQVTNILRVYQTIKDVVGQANALSAATRVMWPTGFGVASGATAGEAAFYLDPADYAVSGYTAKMRLRLMLLLNDTAPACDITLGLYPVGTPTGGAAAITAGTLGSVVASTATISSPAANSKNQSVSADFNVPSAGYYALAFVNTAMAANSSAAIRAILEGHAV